MAHGFLYVVEAERRVPVDLKLEGIILVREPLDEDTLTASVGHRLSHPRYLVVFEDGSHEVVVWVLPGLHGSRR